MDEFIVSNSDKMILYCSTYNWILSKVEITKNVNVDSLDLNYIVEFINKHKLQNLFVYNCISSGIYDDLSDEFKQYIDQSKVQMMNEYEKKKNEIIRITEYLQKLDYTFVFLKGISITELVYKDNPWARFFNDIDILSDEKQADDLFLKLTTKMGYSCDSSEQERHIYKTLFQHHAPINKDKVWVELHHRLTQENDSYCINTERLLNNRAYVDINGSKIPILSLESILINQCYHMFQHEYRETRYMLKLPADIFNFIHNLGTSFDWNNFIRLTKEDHLEFPVYYSLYNTNLLFKKYLNVEIVPEFVLKQLLQDDFTERKDFIISRHLFSEEPIGTWKEDYDERIFTDLKIIRNKLCRYAFIHFAAVAWQKECDKYGINYDDVYGFTPKIWVDLGRL